MIDIIFFFVFWRVNTRKLHKWSSLSNNKKLAGNSFTTGKIKGFLLCTKILEQENSKIEPKWRISFIHSKHFLSVHFLNWEPLCRMTFKRVRKFQTPLFSPSCNWISIILYLVSSVMFKMPFFHPICLIMAERRYKRMKATQPIIQLTELGNKLWISRTWIYTEVQGSNHENWV